MVISPDEKTLITCFRSNYANYSVQKQLKNIPTLMNAIGTLMYL
jgi:hypothetical protein